jgi:hypothetical protein
MKCRALSRVGAGAGLLPLITREVRWFFDGSLAATGAATAAWFAAGAKAAAQAGPDSRSQEWRPQEWRTDRYVSLPNADDVGVKLRQGRLEIKGCHSRVGVRRFGDGAEGEVACWTKWTVDAPEWHEREGASGVWPGLAVSAMLPIAKQRAQRRLALMPEGVADVSLGNEVEHGLHMELTRLRVADAGDDTHWSLGFEAAPDGPVCDAFFVEVVTRLLSGCPSKPLGAENSMSYPRWLQRLGAGNIRNPD